jgi:6-phosphogluconolactonase
MEFIVNYKIQISKSTEELSEHFAQLLIDKVNNNKDLFHIALSGGSTPKSIFEYLAAHHQNTINWNKVNFYWGDERCVPPTDIESNYKMAYDSLLGKLQIPASNIFRINGENDPPLEAKRYSEIVKKLLPKNNNIPQFDMVMLGLGEDGHTASIFPGNIDLFNSENLFEVSQHTETKQKRITVTGRIINNAKQVFFLVTGENKSDRTAQIIEKKNGWQYLPASLVQPTDGELVWMLDYPAAQKLNSSKT